MLALVGFLILITIVILIFTKKVTALIALLLVPIVGCILVGDIAHLGQYMEEGFVKMAPTGIMLLFAILFFGLMRDVGVFDPVTNFIVRKTKGNPVAICIGTYILTLVGHLDGAGATTALLVIPAMMPIYDKLHMRRVSLVTIIAIAAGTFNIMPWGGPTLLCAGSLGVPVDDLFKPMIPAVVVCLFSGLAMAVFIGKLEKKRLEKENISTDAAEAVHDNYDVHAELSAEQAALLRPKLRIVNVVLILAVLVSMLLGVMAPSAIFAIALVLAFMINYRDKSLQESLINTHAEDAILTAAVIFAAGCLNGILTGTGMSAAMAEAIVDIIPVSLASHLPVVCGILAVPSSFIIENNILYSGVLPVLAEAMADYGVSSLELGRAWLVGQGTIGAFIIPFYGAVILMMGLAKVDFADVQKFAFKFLWIQSIIFLTVMVVTGAIPL